MKLLLVASALLGMMGGDHKDGIPLGHKAPEFSLTSMEKGATAKKFSEISKDKITVVDFWSCRCPFSIAWEDRLKALHDEYSKKGVEFVVIDSNSTENAEDIEKYKETAKFPYAIYLDPKSEIANIFGAKTTPHVYVFNKKGELEYMGAIDDDSKGQKKMEERKNYLKDALEALVHDKKVSVTTSTPAGCSIKRPKA